MDRGLKNPEKVRFILGKTVKIRNFNIFPPRQKRPEVVEG